MKVRVLLWVTAIVSSLLGALVVYLVLSVPNDLRADALLKDARKSLEAGKTQEARASLSQIVQQYPRTDAAAAATVALVTVVDSERAKVQKNLETVVLANRQQEARITALEKSVGVLQTPPPAPVTVQAPPPAPAPVKKVTPAKKPAPKKPARRRRR
jgi:thioredoxin-like negative regulator of GroEL